MSKGLPTELANKFAADREARKAPSGEETRGSRETMKRAKAKAKKAMDSTYRK